VDVHAHASGGRGDQRYIAVTVGDCLQAYRRSLAANGEGTAGLSQSLMVLAVTATGTELRYLSAAGGPPST